MQTNTNHFVNHIQLILYLNNQLTYMIRLRIKISLLKLMITLMINLMVIKMNIRSLINVSQLVQMKKIANGVNLNMIWTLIIVLLLQQ